jgi:uncharacterized protein (TIGR02147 family)
LSQVSSPSSSIQLTRDHAAGLCQFWGFTDDESEYYLALVELARAKSRPLRDFALQKIEQLKSRRTNLDRRVRKEGIDNIEVQSIYYSTWINSAVHILLTIPSFREPRAIAQRLQIQIAEVERALAKLAEIGLAEKKGELWLPISANLNLPTSSPLNTVNHTNWRCKAISSLQNRRLESLHFSSVFSANRKDVETLRTMISDFILRSRDLIVSSKEEDIYCLNIDCFDV